MEIKVKFNLKEEKIITETVCLFYLSKEKLAPTDVIEKIANDLIDLIEEIESDVQEDYNLKTYLNYIVENIVEEPPTKKERVGVMVDWLYDEPIHHEHSVLQALKSRLSHWEIVIATEEG